MLGDLPFKSAMERQNLLRCLTVREANRFMQRRSTNDIKKRTISVFPLPRGIKSSDNI